MNPFSKAKQKRGRKLKEKTNKKGIHTQESLCSFNVKTRTGMKWIALKHGTDLKISFSSKN